MSDYTRLSCTRSLHFFTPRRNAALHDSCPTPTLSCSVSFVSDPPTWLPRVLVGHLYAVRPCSSFCDGLRANTLSTAWFCAPTNSLRSAFAMQGELAAVNCSMGDSLLGGPTSADSVLFRPPSPASVAAVDVRSPPLISDFSWSLTVFGDLLALLSFRVASISCKSSTSVNNQDRNASECCVGYAKLS